MAEAWSRVELPGAVMCVMGRYQVLVPGISKQILGSAEQTCFEPMGLLKYKRDFIINAIFGGAMSVCWWTTSSLISA